MTSTSSLRLYQQKVKNPLLSIESMRKICNMPRDYSKTDVAIHYMLDSEAGRSILDSGAAYGYNNDRNKALSACYNNDKRKMPSAVIAACYGDIEASSSLFHVLRNSVEYNPRLTRQFHEFAANYDESWLTCLEAWFNHIEAVKGLGENTHSDEYVSIDQIIQFDTFEDKDGDYHVAIQSHNGCDIRGGYSMPYIFDIDHVDDFILDLSNCVASCSCTTAYIRGVYVEYDASDEAYDGWPESWKEFSQNHKDTSKVYCVNCADRVRAYSCGL